MRARRQTEAKPRYTLPIPNLVTRLKKQSPITKFDTWFKEKEENCNQVQVHGCKSKLASKRTETSQQSDTA